jgi:spermidine synthase
MKSSSSRRTFTGTIVGLTLILAGLAAFLLFGGVNAPQLEVDQQSDYSHIRIRRQGNLRTLLFVRDNGREVVESRLNLDSPHELMLPYTRAMFASYLFKPQQDRVLIVGLGGGSMVHFLKHHHADLRVDVVEIDPVVVALAERYFDVRSEGNVNILTTDGFDYLRNTDQTYDVIYMDAFLKPSAGTDTTGVPQRLKTIAFYASIQTKLKPDGLVVFNLNRHADTAEDIRTIESAFPNTTTFRCPGSANLVVVGSLAAQPPGPELLQARADESDDRFQANFTFRQLLNDRQ